MEKYIVIAIIVLGFMYFIGKRNTFVRLKQAVDEQTSNISNYREKRAKYLEDALSVAAIAHRNEIEGISKLTGNEQYDNLLALSDKYPELMSNKNYSIAMSQLELLNGDIAASKVLLNGNIREYNNEISMFPAIIVAKILGCQRETFIDEENMRENKVVQIKEVDLSKY